MIAALFVERGGAYWGRPDVDAWDEARDARRYSGPLAVVAHPPCSVWGHLAHVNQARYGHRVGNDGGCFEHALRSVRAFGGVLEHPAGSHAWEVFGLQRPPARGWQRAIDGSWVCEVRQRAYGHRARKATWLFAICDAPPELDWSDPAPAATVSFLKNHGDSGLPRLCKREARSTPPAFRDILIQIAMLARSTR